MSNKQNDILAEQAYELAYDIFYAEGFRGDELDELIDQQTKEV